MSDQNQIYSQTNFSQRLLQVNQRIQKACRQANRDTNSVALLAVSKGQELSALREAIDHGIMSFGENYLQEALIKKDSLNDLKVKWHYIGTVQSNKTKAIAQHFDWVHTIAKLKHAQQLHKHRQGYQPLNVCIQVNIDQEETKNGVMPAEVLNLAKAVLKLPSLRLRGLMSIPKPENEVYTQPVTLNSFERLKNIQKNVQQALSPLPYSDCMSTLSMGMSKNIEAAVAAGSTLVRIGSALFGPRNLDPETKRE